MPSPAEDVVFFFQVLAAVPALGAKPGDTLACHSAGQRTDLIRRSPTDHRAIAEAVRSGAIRLYHAAPVDASGSAVAPPPKRGRTELPRLQLVEG